MGEPKPTKVDCQDCGFSERVAPEDDRLPADVLTEHGEETGHLLTLERGVE